MLEEGSDIPPEEDRPGLPSSSHEGLTNGIESVELSAFDDLAEDCGVAVHPDTQHTHDFRISEPIDFSENPTPDFLRQYNFQRRLPPRDGYYCSEANRLQSFRGWPASAPVLKEDLARNGFTYTGTGDKVRCVFCNGMLMRWQPGDVVEEEHRQGFPHCPFLQGEDVGNIPLVQTANGHAVPNRNHQLYVESSSGAHPDEDRHGAGRHLAGQTRIPYLGQRPYFPRTSNGQFSARQVPRDSQETNVFTAKPCMPQMAAEPDRLGTFENWPAQMRQRPEKLAEAGLYYIGDGDKVKCFYCDGLLYNWEPEDDPWVEHAKWFPNCQYVQLVKGNSFVEDTRNRKSNHDDLMQTPSVLAVLSEGYTSEQVKKAVDVLREKEGPDVVVTGEKLLRQVMELEQKNGLKSNINGHAASADVRQLMEENENLKDKQLCKICMEKDVEVIFYPCRHLVCCATCGAAVSSCPVCRCKIESVDKVFLV